MANTTSPQSPLSFILANKPTPSKPRPLASYSDSELASTFTALQTRAGEIRAMPKSKQRDGLLAANTTKQNAIAAIAAQRLAARAAAPSPPSAS